MKNHFCQIRTITMIHSEMYVSVIRVGINITLTNLSLTSRTCSYLLGNKGAHITHGNPHNKDDVTQNPIRALIEKEVHRSVGFIHLDKLDEDEDDGTEDGFNSHGTGFRVGDCYMMTAYHVLRDRIETMIDNITFEVNILMRMNIDDILDTLKMKHDESASEPRDIIKSFLKQNEEFRSRETNIWKKHCVVNFLDHENKTTRFDIDWRIEFGCEERDLLVLKLVKITSDQEMPPRLFLAEKYEQVDKMFIIRYMNKRESKIVMDKECEIFTDDRNLEEAVKTSLKWWTSIFPDNANMISYEGCTKAHNIKTGRIILRAAASFIYGSSGSPIVYFNQSEYKGLVFVGMVYQRGFPLFYYKRESFWDRRIHEETKQSVNNDVLFEGCTTLQKLAELLLEHNKIDLKDNIFDTKMVKRQYVKEQVTADQRTGNYDHLYDEILTIQDKKRFRLTDMIDVVKEDCQPTDDMKLIVNQWKKDEEYFIETTASRHIYQEIETSNILTIVGPSDSGKSFCMHHVALKLQRQGYTLFVITDCCEIKQFIKSSDKKKLFLVDDPIGVDSIDNRKLKEWKSYSDHYKVLFRESIKLLMTIRTEYFNCLKKHESIFHIATVSLHSESLEMSSVEKDMFFREVVFKRNIEVPPLDPVWNMVKMCEFNNFVKLVYMYCADEYFRQNPADLFVEPLGALETHFVQMWENNSKQFGGLVLCAVNEDKLPKGLFDPFDSKLKPEKQKAKYLLEKLSINSNLQLVEKELEKLHGVYVNKDKLSYTLRHKVFGTSVLYVVAKRNIGFIIDHCDTGFCLDWFCLSRKQINPYTPSLTKTGDKYRISEVHENTEDSLAVKFTLSLKDNIDMVKRIFSSSFCYDAKFLRKIFLAIKSHLNDDQFKTHILYQVYCNASLVNAVGIRDELHVCFDEFTRPCITGLTPLIACTYAGDINHLKVLLTSNCDVNVSGTGRHETTALCAASILGSAMIVKLLLNNGANINQCDGKRQTPIIAAVIGNNTDVVELLLERNADISICGTVEQSVTFLDDGNHLPPLEIANLLNNESMVDILQKHTKHSEPLIKKPRII